MNYIAQVDLSALSDVTNENKTQRYYLDVDPGQTSLSSIQQTGL